MALSARIKSVNYAVSTVNAQGATETIDHSRAGNLVANVEYIDSAAPETVLASRRFTFNATMDEAQMTEEIFAYARLVLAARTRTTELQQYVNVVIPVPPAPEPEV